MARAQRIAAAVAGIAAILLASLALTGVVRADEDETIATASDALHPTQVIAEIPDRYNELFPLQWGGGSLYQLKARLATMGCIANTIWNYDDDAWHVYNQYNVPSTLNAKWLAAYENFVPAGTLYADCFDICEFNYFEAPRDEPCLSLESDWEEVIYHSFPPLPIEASAAECIDGYDERVIARVLPSMATYPDICVIRQQEAEATRAFVSYPIWGFTDVLYPAYRGNLIVLYHRSAPVRIYLANEIHEFCHTNQYFHFIQGMQPDKIRTAASYAAVWYTTKAGSAFRDLTGFVQNAEGEYPLPDDTYDGIYAKDPTELAAELCTMYFMDKVGEEQRYICSSFDNTERRWVLECRWSKDAEGRWVLVDKRDFDSSRYLTPDIVEWIETWVALPEIPVPETEEAVTGSASDAQSQ